MREPVAFTLKSYIMFIDFLARFKRYYARTSCFHTEKLYHVRWLPCQV